MKLKLLLLFVLFCTSLSAQKSPQACRASEVNNKLFEERTPSFVEHHKFNDYSRTYQRNTNNSTYIIPVVFHVFGDVQSGKTVTYDKIVTLVEKLNDDFNGLNPDFDTVDGAFSSIKSTLDIQFRLATIDPNGGCTTGVVFHNVESGFGNGSGYDSTIQQYAWDNYKYMNVYIQNDLYNDGDLYNSGVAWYPDTWMSDNDLARVVYNGSYIHGNTNAEFASTMTHEFGHWLNLIHTFEGGCNGTDEVADTPSENGSHDLDCSPGYNCNGSYVNIENYMGYNGSDGCYKMFTAGQVARMEAALNHPARQPLWQESNLIATGVYEEPGSLALITSNKEEVYEDDLNNGSFSQTVEVNIIGGNFANSSGTLTEGTDYTVDIANGLNVEVTLNSNSSATISITGQAAYHDVSNNSVFSIELKDNALSGGTSSFSCNTLAYELKYYAPYEVVYVDIDDIEISPSFVWQWFGIEVGDDNAYGAFLDANSNSELKIETYTKPLICEGNTLNITYLEEDEPVDATRNFVDGGDYPDLHNLRSQSYTTWDGKEGYVGFEYKINGRTCYGWFKLSVSENGDSYTLKEYAYNTAPNQTIYTGYNNSNVGIEENPMANFHIYPNPAKETLNLTIGSDYKNLEFYITDMNGKILKKFKNVKNNSYISLEINDLDSGLYNVTIIKDGGIIFSDKFLKK
ncbi:zinc-dependent metalloprotease [Aureivirga sp. CE67]|uniref:zinc-dependent metalloprotease n=1 Tax=Aureivirga sp. CE67 TaxID=1788983 RepID=UPI0018CA329E|nr:zinc-dependent metalloprotease [Aureivirga sp. CE67]